MKAKTLAVAAALILALPLSAASNADYIPTISVSGSAEVSMAPDTASFTVTASFVENTTEEAREKTATLIANAVNILKENYSIPEENLSTEYISASPEYGYVDDERVIIGQRATQSINVTLKDLDSIGDIYTELMALDGISLSDVSLDKEDKSEELREARMNAVQDAYSKASAYAEAAGVRVGKVLSISDSSYAAPMYRANMMLAAADAAIAESTPITFYSDDITVSASVSLTYAIEQ